MRNQRLIALLSLIGLVVITTVTYTQSRTESPKTLQGYYQQKLDWQQCYSNYQCADLLVPIDYQDLATGTFSIAVLKFNAYEPSKRLGSLVVNPGGPGASGVDYAYAAEYIFSPDIITRYDIVGFDPRGVARSAPITCLNDEETDAAISSDGHPDNPAELKQALIDARTFINKCKENNPHLTSFTTENAARDMDILRQALGDKQLNFMGKSYGTYLGTLYAKLFPYKVGRMVLDGAIDPNISTYQQSLAQAVGFDTALNAFIKDCTSRTTCPLPTNQTLAKQEITQLFTQAKVQPLPRKVKKENDERLATESILVLGTASALYDSETGWPLLRRAITQAQSGYGDVFLRLADEYSGRQPDGTFPNNEFDSGAIIDCLDFKDERTLQQIKKGEATFTKSAPVFGPYLAYSGINCNYIKAPTQPKRFADINTPNTIVIIGTTRDPATPYRWAQGLSQILTNSVLISLNGDGHTGHGRGNMCVDDQVDAYYLDERSPRYSVCSEIILPD